METLKEILIDLLIVVAAWVIVTAEGVYDKGLSCGDRTEVTAQAEP